MELQTVLCLLFFLACSSSSTAYKRPSIKREHSPFSDDLLTSETKNEGFLEDINFKSFFEDVGLKSSDSAPKIVRHHRPGQGSQRFQLEAQADGNDYGFLPAEPLFKPSESRNRFTIISSDNDFFAQESSPFDDYYGFDSNPYSASQHHRDYLSPYSESRQSTNFEDYGPPKGFFDHDFSASFSNNDKDKNNEKATQETKSEPKYQGEPSQNEKEKTKKCEKIHKDKMTCEICKDDFGGFSEHCSHSLHSGKDQKYANSRKNSHEDTYNPLNNQGGNKDGASSNNRAYERNNQGGNKDGAFSNNRAYESPVSNGYSGSHNSGAPQKNNNKNNFYDPYPQQSKLYPYNFDYLKEIDEMINAGLKDVSEQQKKLGNAPPQKTAKSTKQKEESKDTEKQASNKEPQQNEAEPEKRKIPIGHPNHPNYQTGYKPLNPVQNFQVLGKMVKQFGKKDRKHCKKRVTKEGMTCYVCPNKHGQVDEECMYENKDPSQGVHMMYKEEVSY